jgi:hypothetical protein
MSRFKLIIVCFALAVALIPGRASATTCLGCIIDVCKQSADTCNCTSTRGCIGGARGLCELVGSCIPVVFQPGFDETAELSSNGRVIAVGGPIDCTAGARIQFIRVTVTQDGAITEGRIVGGVCAGSGDEWAATLHAQGRAGFTTGPATACGLGVLGDPGDTLATFQWCREITLVVP